MTDISTQPPALIKLNSTRPLIVIADSKGHVQAGILTKIADIKESVSTAQLSKGATLARTITIYFSL